MNIDIEIQGHVATSASGGSGISEYKAAAAAVAAPTMKWHKSMGVRTANMTYVDIIVGQSAVTVALSELERVVNMVKAAR